MPLSLTDLQAILPEGLITLCACTVLMVDLFLERERRWILAYFSLVALLLVGAVTTKMIWVERTAFSGMFILDPYSSFFKLVLCAAAGITILLSMDYLQKEEIHLGEYYAFVLLATCGMMIMVSGLNLIMIYLGLELMTISFYILVGFKGLDVRSVEASAKYFVLGSFSSAILLYGIVLVYGLTGSIQIDQLAPFFAANRPHNLTLTLAMLLLVVGFGFKVAVVPFHMWTPDVYEGAPTPVTAFLSVGSKAASFAVFVRVFLEAFGEIQSEWQGLLIPVAIVTLALGTVVAIVQNNIKRMLAYSSIAHAGYALIGLLTASHLGITSVMVYLLVYTFMNLGAFGMVILVRRGGAEGDQVSDFSGLSRQNPLAAFAMLIFMLSLAGIPPTAGFWAKWYIFMAAVQVNLTYLAVIGVLFTVVSAYFYLRVVMVMYMREPEGLHELALSPAAIVALVITAGVTLLVGLYPEPVFQYAQEATLRVQQQPMSFVGP